MKLFEPPLQFCSDEELMVQVKNKNAAAFEELYNRYSKIILYYLFKMLGGSEAQAQDLLHDIFLKIIEKPFLFDQSKKFKTWIFQIAHNKCKNEYRKKDVRNQPKVKFEINEIYSHNATSPEVSIDLNKMSKFINYELSKFDEKHYSTFVLRYQHELPIKEIAEISECPEGTVKSRLFNVTKKITEKVKEYYN